MPKTSKQSQLAAKLPTLTMMACCLLGGPLWAQDGIMDIDFGTAGRATLAFDLGGTNEDWAGDMLIQPDGKILLVGQAAVAGPGYRGAVARLNSDGTPDSSFSGDGRQELVLGTGHQYLISVGLQNDKIIVAGITQILGQDYDFIVARLDSNGSLDNSFGANGMRTVFFDLGPDKTDRLEDMAVQPDGKIVLVGSVQTYLNATDTSDDMGLARLTADGDLDETFSGDGKKLIFYDIAGPKHDQAMAVAVQPDGKIVVAAVVSVGDSDTDMAIVRLTSTGGFDSSFGTGGSGGIIVPFNLGPSTQYEQVWDVALQGRKIVAAGNAEVSGSGSDMAVIRLNANGTLDSSFSTDGKQTVSFDLGGANNDFAYAVTLQGDGKIVLAGSTMRGPTDVDFALARLRLDGELDDGFDGDGKRAVAFDLGGDLIDVAEAVDIQRDGKIVAAGTANSASGANDMAVARVTSTAVLFSDGFETGDTEIWSAEVP